MNAVDTNILVYSLDDTEPIKQAKAQALLGQVASGSTPTFLLWQVLGEFVQQLRRWKDQSLLTEAQFTAHIQVHRALFPLVLPTPLVIDHALDLCRRFTLSHWDSMILGACRDARITTLFTEDMGAPRIIDGIQLANPFI
jgi:predicted nucleic acid-binding protein